MEDDNNIDLLIGR